jgi:hypothetical protein
MISILTDEKNVAIMRTTKPTLSQILLKNMEFSVGRRNGKPFAS